MNESERDPNQHDGGADAPTENHLIAERRAKLAKLRERGRPFPNDFRRNVLAQHLHDTYGAQDAEALEREAISVAVAGRMMAKRIMGKASFARLQDSSGSIQLFLQAQGLGGTYEDFRGFDVGDVIGAEGTLFRTRTGELSVRVTRLCMLTKSLRPLPDKWHGVADTELRYRQRYVDLIMNEASRRTFEMRSRITRYLRDLLEASGFLEVETPMLQPIPGGAAARPFRTHHNALDMDMYLRIAPELYLKRLTVGGLERVYEINRNFRNEGLSTQHNPEFTMLELYWAYADYADVMELVERMFHGIADSLIGSRRITYQGREYDLSGAFRRVSIEDIVLENNPWLDRSALRDVAALRAACDRLGIAYRPGDGAGKLQTEIFEKTGEHTLIQPTFAYAYPAEVSPLARRNDEDPFVTDRFELFIGGREYANGFSELNDAEDQAQRFRDQVARKSAGDEEAMYYDADYVRALEYGMPPAGGLGVGIDRLVMFFTDSPSIRDVLLFPHMRPET
ncbi:MAG: lysine--tRNA ligase [Gammaproteobacteria bacterium]|nr:lysine--tRNA ligase [Gammaproteobacteria bacterium]